MEKYLDRLPMDHILFLFMCLVVLLTTLHAIPTADLWMFLAMGKHLVATLSFPETNFFSYTASDFKVIDHEWIPEIIFYGLHNAGGFTSLYIFKSAMVFGSFFLLLLAARRRGVALVFCILAVMICAPLAKGNFYFDIRPYLFTYLFLAVLLYFLEDFSGGRKSALLYIMPFICWTWVNSHGAFILYFILLILFILSHFIQYVLIEKRAMAPELQALVPLLCILLAGALLSFINPYSTRLLSFPLKFIGPSIYRDNLIEWAEPHLLGVDLPFLIFLIVVTLLVVIMYRKFRVFDFLALMFFGYLAITTVRHITLFCLVSVPVVAVLLESLYAIIAKRQPGQKIGSMIRNLSPGILNAMKLISVLGFFLLACVKLSAVDFKNLNMEKTLFPKYGVEFIKKNNLPAPLYNPYEWGGYLLWTIYPDYKVFIDGRVNNAYHEQVYKDYLTLMFGRQGWEEILTRYGVNTVLCNKFYQRTRKEKWLGHLLEQSPYWKLIYEDRAEQIFVRNDVCSEDILKKAREGKLVIPESAFYLQARAMENIPSGDLDIACSLLESALRKDPSYLDLYVNLGFVYYSMGKHRKAEKILQDVLRKQPGLYIAHDLLGVVYHSQGKTGKARVEFNRALRIYPEFEHSKEMLRTMDGK